MADQSSKSLSMAARETWTFEKWFEEQHGPRPSRYSTKVLWKRVSDLEQALSMAREKAEETALWDEKLNSALYAWQIPDERKRGRRD